jgi:general secretion pathway protein G
MGWRIVIGNSAIGNRPMNKSKQGFTFIELMVVMAIIATIVAIAMPRYFDGLQRTKETALKQNLKEMRDAIDHYHADKGVYPATLQAMVTERYLRFIPDDPITEAADTWQIVNTPNSENRVYDVTSGAAEVDSNGVAYSSW